MRSKTMGMPWFLALMAAAIFGSGLSLLEWGDPEGVHGTGWPVPSRISGLPKEASSTSAWQVFSGMGDVAILANIALVAIFGIALWGIAKLILLLSGRA